MHLEAKDLGLVPTLALVRQHGRIHLEQDVVKRGAEVSAIDDGVARGLWVVEVFAAGTVELHGGRVGQVGLAHGEERLRFAHDARAFSKVGFLELLELGGGRGRLSANVVLCRTVGEHTIFARPLVVTM